MIKAIRKLKSVLTMPLSVIKRRLVDDEKALLLMAQILSKKNEELSEIKDLSAVEFSVFSQWGEDGIIDWLNHRLSNLPKVFVEFGVEDYLEANTRLLLKMRGWKGVVFDGSKKHVQEIRKAHFFWKYALEATHAFIDRDNLNDLIRAAGIDGDIGLLSVDIDGNDYWVWDVVDAIRPVIVVAEYNTTFGDIYRITVPYSSSFVRNTAHYSNLYFGASLPALISLGEAKGYRFIGTTSSGVNAFFIRNDFATQLEGRIENYQQIPSQHREARNRHGRLSFVSARAGLSIIRDLPVVDLESGKVVALSELGELYSEHWQEK